MMLWETLLRLALGYLGAFVAAFVRNLRDARLDDPNLVAVIDRVVRGIATDHPEWSGEQKRAYAIDAAKVYLTNVGRDLKESILNTLLELSVQKLKDEKGTS